MTKRAARGIGLLSGGLDSMLAVMVLKDQGVEVLGLTFVTPFFGAEAGLLAGKKTRIPMRAVDFGEIHLAMLKNPRYGYGSQMNPCIDCHALMLREAGRIMEEEGYDFLFTGEVLGQRPMSQRRDALRAVENLAGYPGRILRPLSARLLPATIPEEEGLVDRERLLAISGRARKDQAALAERYGIREYPNPGGGCMLTREGFARRLRRLLETRPEATVREVELLKWGRQFFLPSGARCIVGRNQADNKRIEQFAGPRDLLMRLLEYPGPRGLLSEGGAAPEDLDLAAEIVASYGDAPAGALVRVSVSGAGAERETRVSKGDNARFAGWLT